MRRAPRVRARTVRRGTGAVPRGTRRLPAGGAVTTVARPHPFDLVFGPLVDVHFPAIREALPPDADLDAFLVCTPALELLQELRPDEGLGEAVDDFVAFVHAAWRYWVNGAVTRPLDAETTRALCDADGLVTPAAPRVAQYIQVAPRLVWGQLADGEQWEPLDGW